MPTILVHTTQSSLSCSLFSWSKYINNYRTLNQENGPVPSPQLLCCFIQNCLPLYINEERCLYGAVFCLHLRISNLILGFAASYIFTSERICLLSQFSVWNKNNIPFFSFDQLMYGCVRLGTVCLYNPEVSAHQDRYYNMNAMWRICICFSDCCELSFQASIMVTQATPSGVCHGAQLAREKEDIFKDWKCAKEWKFLLTEAGCISWTGDFLFMAHYNWLFSQVPPEKMYGDYSPRGLRVETDASFPGPWLFSIVFLDVFLVML